MKSCKTVTTMSCVNQFFFFLALVGCSDRSVRVYDLNQGKVLRSLANCHSRPVYSILQNQGSPRLSHPDRGYDLFLTAALGDGASLWDLRRAGSVCVQKFDSVVAGRHQCGLALSPCMRFLAAGGEDGHLTIYDTRQVCSLLFSRIQEETFLSFLEPKLLMCYEEYIFTYSYQYSPLIFRCGVHWLG